jgi:hypothetical protein
MKLTGKISALLIVMILMSAAHRARAQNPKLEIDALNPLTARAVESIEVSLDHPQLQFVRKLARLDQKDGGRRLANLDGVYVRLLEFSEDGAYAASDVEQIRTQLRTQGWVPYRGTLAGGRDLMDAFIMERDGGIIGYAAFHADPRAICLINITGRITQDDLNELRDFDCKNWGQQSRRRQTR